MSTQAVRLEVWVLVEDTERVLSEAQDARPYTRTIEQIVRDEVQSNLDSVRYARHVRIQILDPGPGKSGTR